MNPFRFKILPKGLKHLAPVLHYGVERFTLETLPTGVVQACSMIFLMLLLAFLISIVAAVAAARAMLAFLFAALLQPKSGTLGLREPRPAL
jgi:hypothetical protein